MNYRYSIIIPVYNRPDELQELLNSLQQEILQNEKKYKEQSPFAEIIIVDDGSQTASDAICKKFESTLKLKYIYQENTGPAGARNTGAKKASGEWLLFFDSDCILPEGYFQAVEQNIKDTEAGLWGGPDKAAVSFSPIQKAIDYSMTSFLTTGGIRGKKKSMDTYYPRTFNLGVRRSAFDEVGGFSNLRFGEDLDFSMRILKKGYQSLLIEEAYVYHKRRNTYKTFFKQVYNSGMARVVLNKLHPGTLKTVHLLPTLFTVFLLFSLSMLPFGNYIPAVFILAYMLILFADGWRNTKSLSASARIPFTSILQLTGYGMGLLHAVVLIHILGKNDARAFEKSFYT
ncbi:glycosyltransferase [Balneolaceae bacterium ANBcel3]|nr:glycosyltransferase [Balneolaceae bacterium ANBcel3]